MEIRAKIIPNSKKESIEELRDGRFSIKVNADRKAGLAHERAIILIANYFGLESKKIKIISGHTSQTKTFLVSAR